MKKFILRSWLINEGKFIQQDDPDHYVRYNVSIKFFRTEEGVEMINCVDITKARHSWQFFKFEVREITSEGDVEYLLRGSTAQKS